MTRHNTPALRLASARWQARRRRLIKLGQWEPFVDSEPVREHLKQINASGMSYWAIAKRLGLAQESSLQHLMWGRDGYGPSKLIRAETAELVMGFWPALEDFPDAARIDSTGTRRRVEALAVRGWPRHMMAKKAGMGEQAFRKACNKDRVPARMARAVVAVYDAWWNQDPLEHGVPLNSVTRVRGDAKRCGFHSALAWDDDTIDDPAARPMVSVDTEEPDVVDMVAVQRYVAGSQVVLSDTEFLVAMQEFQDRGMSRAKVDALHGLEKFTTERAVYRLKRQYERAGREWPLSAVVCDDLALISSPEFGIDEMESAA
ncbi:hypothetical protein [Streptomyces sp. NPDC060366]|uniref:hypothetical protein n=1 Tax=Streptomyces sp. NPDC060366 TaxID=3347105 RepID=UPI003651B941